MSYNFELTQHAKEKITERAIPLEWIERTLIKPQKTEVDKTDPNLRHALATIPEFDDRVLRVVYNFVEQPCKIVTVYFDRNMRGRL